MTIQRKGQCPFKTATHGIQNILAAGKALNSEGMRKGLEKESNEKKKRKRMEEVEFKVEGRDGIEVV